VFPTPRLLCVPVPRPAVVHVEPDRALRSNVPIGRFLGPGLGDRVPDAKTVWPYRDALAQAGQVEELFRRFDHCPTGDACIHCPAGDCKAICREGPTGVISHGKVILRGVGRSWTVSHWNAIGPRELPAEAPPVRAPLATANDRAGAAQSHHARRERNDQEGRGARGLGRQARQAMPERPGRPLERGGSENSPGDCFPDEQAWQEPLRLQEPRECGPHAQAGAALSRQPLSGHCRAMPCPAARQHMRSMCERGQWTPPCTTAKRWINC